MRQLKVPSVSLDHVRDVLRNLKRGTDCIPVYAFSRIVVFFYSKSVLPTAIRTVLGVVYSPVAHVSQVDAAIGEHWSLGTQRIRYMDSIRGSNTEMRGEYDGTSE